MKVTAAVAGQAAGPMEITEVELDYPGSDEILVRVEAVGICHDDMNARDGHLQGAGTVERVRSAVTGFVPGDRVSPTGDSCGRCRECLVGRIPYSDNVLARDFVGFRPDGLARAHRGDTRFPFERLLRDCPFDQINTAFADSLSGRTTKTVLTWEIS